MTEIPAPADAVEPQPAQDPWEQLLATMRLRYPGQKDSVLFCLLKLHQNPQLTLRDFRDEARMYGLNLAGRSLHSAKVLLGLAAPSPKPKRTAPTQSSAASNATAASKSPATRGRAPSGQGASTASLEAQLLDLVRQMHAPVRAENERLRQAMREVLDVIAAALHED